MGERQRVLQNERCVKPRLFLQENIIENLDNNHFRL